MPVVSVPNATEFAWIVKAPVPLAKLVNVIEPWTSPLLKLTTGDLLIVTPLAISPVSILTLVIASSEKSTDPACSYAPIFVTVKVDEPKVIAELSDNTPPVPAKTTLPFVKPSAVIVAAVKS